ncbi:MAG: division/cell wall cluster transcriptional repressor MraZ [Candidatus Marinimicrobia bacterium]|nr:division/cell wall cluster transcriptional repressor MraZ [Candidatus Neomarinimicrobiota bacterium]
MKYHFKGSSDHTIDNKNRLNIPAKYRKFFQENNENDLVATLSLTDPCISLYPLSIYENLTESFKEKLSKLDDRQTWILRNWSKNADDCTFDKQGRIILSAKLKEMTKINKDVIIIGTIDQIEIWDPQILEKREKEINISSQDLRNLASERGL